MDSPPNWNERWNNNVPEAHEWPREWQENVRSYGRAVPNGRITTTNPKTGKTTGLTKGPESRILEYLSGKNIKANANTPNKLLAKNATLRAIPWAANVVRERRNQRELNARIAEQMKLNRPRREAEQEAYNKQQKYNAFLRNANLRSSPAYHKALRNQENRNARNTSRVRRGVNKTKKRKN
jgi:hypothetical protein